MLLQMFYDLLTELAIWLVGPPEDGACVSNDCLLNILIENAQDNVDILLPTLQFIEVQPDFAKYDGLTWIKTNLIAVFVDQCP